MLPLIDIIQANGARRNTKLLCLSVSIYFSIHIFACEFKIRIVPHELTAISLRAKMKYMYDYNFGQCRYYDG